MSINLNIMSKIKVLLVIGAVLIATPALAVAIDDNITPQSCNRTDPACAQFLETTSLGQIKWGGLVAGGLRSLTNSFVDGKLGVATLRPSTGEQVLRVDVEGAVGARYYCDENGNHCVRGDQLGGGGGNITITSGPSIRVFRFATSTLLEVNPDNVQTRVSGACPAGQAIKIINRDGTVDCQAVGTGGGSLLTNITSGPSIRVFHGSTTNSFLLEVNPDLVQTRIANICPVGQAIRGVAANGTITCQTVTGSTGDQLWVEVPSGGAIYNKNLGNTVGIGTNNPGGATLLVSQRTTATVGEPIASFVGKNNAFGALIGSGGTGLEAYSLNANVSAIYGHVSGAGAVAVAGDSVGAGETYGAKLTGQKVGTLSKGAIGLYATDLGHAEIQSNLARDNRIPRALANSSKQWAGYFDGDVNINGALNITGAVTVNGQPLAGSQNSYKLGEHCGAFVDGSTLGANANIPCQGINIYKGGAKDKAGSYQCPAKFTLVGSDFQSPGNRYFLTCVRTQQ